MCCSGLTGDYENACPDDATDTKADEIYRPKLPLECLSFELGLNKTDGFARE